MRILFVHVSQNWQGRVYPEYPLGPGIVATIARDAGHDVFFHDMAVDDTPVEEVVGRVAPRIVALSFLSTSATKAGEVIRKLRGWEGITLIAGGIHTSIFPEHVVALGVDVAVVGEGEGVILPLLDAFSRGGDPSVRLSAIPGIVYRERSGRIRKNPPSTTSVDLETLPPVERSIYDLSRYPHHSIITSRGCPYRCKFCCAWGPGGRKGRMASPSRILTELEWLVERYGEMTLYWADDMFFFSQRKRLEFCSMMKERGLPIEWIAQLRADNLNPPLVDALLAAGCTTICLGAESGSDRLLQSVEKGLTRAQIAAGIRCAVEGGLRVKTWWILGLPGGTFEDQLASLDLIAETRPHEVAVHTFVPLPGTIYWEEAERFGIHLPPLDRLEQLYYYGNPGEVRMDGLSAEEMTMLIEAYDTGLQEMGYLPTDRATPETPYVYTSPKQKTTFAV
ncbi:MAG: radical SAM protein [Deltaproteobacteria bacterium]|nr:MAG: radical SAM protein [Deltaproteobacteria bacterium]